MIKHHVPDPMLEQFVEGQLQSSLAAAISIHIDMCQECYDKVQMLQKARAEAVFAESASQDEKSQTDSGFNFADFDMGDMIDDITSDMSRFDPIEPAEVTVEIGPAKYNLHRAIRSMDVDKSVSLGKISRAKIELDEGSIHTHLMHMEAGGEVLEHTHNGFEVTLLLKGSLEDEMGEYVPGDFILRDSYHTHTPRSEKGCICMTIVSDSLRFTSGLSRILNPIGKYLY